RSGRRRHGSLGSSGPPVARCPVSLGTRAVRGELHRVTSAGARRVTVSPSRLPMVPPPLPPPLPPSLPLPPSSPCLRRPGRSLLLRVVREERDVHRGGLLEVVEVHPEAGRCRLQAPVARGSGHWVPRGGPGR